MKNPQIPKIVDYKIVSRLKMLRSVSFIMDTVIDINLKS